MKGLAWELRVAVSITATVIGVIASVICLIFVDSWQTMLVGILIGTLVSIFNFNVMATAGEKVIDMAPGKARTYMTINYLIRYGIYIAALFLAIKVPRIHVAGVVIGFFTSIVALYLIQVLNTEGNRDKIKKLLRRAK